MSLYHFRGQVICDICHLELYHVTFNADQNY
jgi:hypothetical protein